MCQRKNYLNKEDESSMREERYIYLIFKKSIKFGSLIFEYNVFINYSAVLCGNIV